MQFTKNMKMPESIPDTGIRQAVKLMETGGLYRYNFDGEFDGRKDTSILDNELASEVARLEHEFCQYIGYKYAVAVNSCGSALFLSLKAAGVQFQDKVFTNAFTFTAVPSSIVHAGGIPIYVECNSDYVLDIEDLKEKVRLNPDVKFLVLSHMRGHIADLRAIKEICETANIYLIEDCAHSLGAQWCDSEEQEPILVGHHGKIACFSSQSYKILNSGEGGLVATDDDQVAAYCILGAGSYEGLYRKHIARPSDDRLFESMKPHVPNFSLRMSNLTASVIRPQLASLEAQIKAYNHRYEQAARLLSSVKNVYIPQPLEQVTRVGDSLQFNLLHLTTAQVDEFAASTVDRGVKLQVFGSVDNARYFKNWCYSFEHEPQLKKTEDIISFACDIRLSLSLSEEDINLLGYIIKDVLYNVIRDSSSPDYQDGLADHFESTDEIVSKYEGWASGYDAEHYRNGWTVLLNQVAYTLLEYLGKESQILDVGCGTGLFAKELFSYGFNHLHGMDISETSLALSRRLGIYSELYCQELGNSLTPASDTFDAIVSTGVFTRNQVPLNSFQELIRILRPGGIFAVVVRVEDDGFYDNELKKYCTQNILSEVNRVPIKVLSSCSHELVILRRV
ncbi:MAG: aminotransferase class I/II-fold pyridoxal phosphate-dependent enzyme [Cyanobacteria bacterium P01_G01_bin.54]